MTRHRYLRVAAVLAIGTPLTLAAQNRPQASSDSLPRALVEVLLAPVGNMMSLMGIGGGGPPRVIVGKLPSSMVDRLWLPADAVILGGMESSGSATAVIRTRVSEDSLNRAFRTQQLARGWGFMPTNPMPAIGAFQPAPAPPTERPLAFCSLGAFLSIGIETVDGWRQLVVTSGSGGGMLCAPRQAPPRQYTSQDRPMLSNPAGTGEGHGSCIEYRFTGGEGTTMLLTPMTVNAVLDYYAKQLADSGWTMSSGDRVLRTWTKADSAGSREVSLTARAWPGRPGCVEVQMYLTGRHR